MKSSRLFTRASRTLFRNTTAARPLPSLLRPACTPVPITTTQTHNFSTTHRAPKGLQPDTSDPEPPKTEANDTTSTASQPADLSDSKYHEIADQYLNTLQLALEDKAENPDSGYEVEYSAGVLTLTTPKGTYVINKQPPNKQIWLSSPLSGPKRFDWALTTGSVETAQQEKQETETSLVGDDGKPGGGRWVYLRDGTTMSELLKKEAEVDFEVSLDEDPERAVQNATSEKSG